MNIIDDEVKPIGDLEGGTDIETNLAAKEEKFAKGDPSEDYSERKSLESTNASINLNANQITKIKSVPIEDSVRVGQKKYLTGDVSPSTSRAKYKKPKHKQLRKSIPRKSKSHAKHLIANIFKRKNKSSKKKSRHFRKKVTESEPIVRINERN